MKNNTIYLDHSKPIGKRVKDLLARMNLEEKIAQLGSVWAFRLLEASNFSQEKASEYLNHGIGHISRTAGEGNLLPVEVARVNNQIQKHLVEQTRLGIPAIVHDECLSGFSARQATCFPQAIGLASTWDPELIEKMTAIIRSQMRCVGIHQGLSPVLDVCRDPRWGRVEETFGEDPYLISYFGVAYVKGLQGKDLADGVVATGKHFAGYGNSEGGLNWAPAHIPERELHDVFLLPFEAAIKEGRIASIMNAYQEIDGIPCGGSKDLLTDILRTKLGFDGVVVSDYWTLAWLLIYHRIANDKLETAKIALEAGLDIELPETDYYGSSLLEAVKEEKIPMDMIDRSVKRILRMKFSLGLFDKPYVNEATAPEIYQVREHTDAARQLAQESIVLLKNTDNLLPLQKDIKSIAVIGPNADSVRNLLGDYSYPSQLEEAPDFVQTMGDGVDLEMFTKISEMTSTDKEAVTRAYVPMKSILESIKTKVSVETRVHYAKGCDVSGDTKDGFGEALNAALQSDIAIVVVGDKCGLTAECTCGESRDRSDLSLPGQQQALVEAVHQTKTPTIVIIVNGRPFSTMWISENIPAIIEAWLPGQEGAPAIADVLFGDYNPGGKLPISFPLSAGQIPVYYNHKPSGGCSMWTGNYADLSTKPLYPFGHGLSYTSFEYSNLELSDKEVDIHGKLDICCDIKNTGISAGDEVVQLYVHDVYSNITRPVKELKGFKRITLNLGQKKRIVFTLFITQLGFYDRQMQFVVEPGTIEVMIGASSEDIRLRESFEIVGEKTEISKIKSYFSEATVTELG